MIRNQIMRAITYATTKHDKQVRKVEETPYIAHPYRVAMLLKEHGCDSDTVIAGLLHDIVEDTDGTLDEIKSLFGETVTEYVRFLTEDQQNEEWEARKQKSIETIRSAPLPVKLIACADKIDNLQSMIDSEMIHGEGMWQAFERQKYKQQWYYQEMYDSVIQGIDTDSHHPLMYLYKGLLDKFLEAEATYDGN
ncbi:HD domain-containing protein [Pelagirhabdus alkalitolerans]|uniref:HD domain-containing protein n=1 Tax=Pelagirhabdus alkalitolerans TaxID=1612202 RepID=A0A1G6JH28_9BACI|nr:HD domain-containing protein [Pelagirhabdus alkalitolerans]SDC17745.1 HD domain-containing protein [Pelagirhabdus alkalitolerans]